MTPEQKQAVANECYEQLQLDPAARTRPQFCLCMIGLPGSGKSTVLRELIKRFPMIRQTGDDVKVILRERDLSDEYTPEIGGMVSERIKDDGYSVAHDNDFARPDIRASHAEYNRNRGIREIWVRIAPPEQYILQGLERRNVAYFRDKQEQREVYERRKQLHQQYADDLDALPYVYVFDPSKDDLDAQLNEAVEHMKASLNSVV